MVNDCFLGRTTLESSQDKSKQSMKTEISQFTYKGQDIDVLFNKGKISYIFERNGKRFGNMVKVDGRKSLSVIQASVALVLNAVETLDAAEKL